MKRKLTRAMTACFSLAMVLAVGTAARAGPFDLDTKLIASDAAEGDQFGFSVGVSGDTAIIGASDNHAAYLFDVNTGNQLRKLTSRDGSRNSFGWSVAIDGNTAIIGTPWDEDRGHNAGAAYLFDVTTGEQLFKLTAGDAVEDTYFGAAVAISGDVAIVAARFDDVGKTWAPVAYLLDVSTGEAIIKLTARDAAPEDQFGNSVGISDGTAIVGAFSNDDAGKNSGSAYLYTGSLLSSDLTGNGFVDFEDLTVLLANWNKDVTAADGNLVEPLTSVVNFEDLTVLLADWTGPGAAGSPAGALGAEAVPEPSTLAMALVLALVGLPAVRRRRRGGD